MNQPPATAPKAEWRAWARTLDPVDPEVAAAVDRHVIEFLEEVAGPVLGYHPLPDEVALGVSVDAVARLGVDGALVLDGGEISYAPAEFAAVVVPGRVFDIDGYRLGRGGGHYDRLLPMLGAGVPVVGITCTARLVDRLPREPHDIPMTHIATEAGVTQVNSISQR